MKKPPSKDAHNRLRPFYFTVQPRPTAHSQELIFHIMKSRDQTSVLLSVVFTLRLKNHLAPLFDALLRTGLLYVVRLIVALLFEAT